MKTLSNIFTFLFMSLILFIVILNIDNISENIIKIFKTTEVGFTDPANDYNLNRDYFFVKKSNDFIPYSKQDIINIFYSVLDNGYDSFTFYCPSEYTDCLNDVESVGSNQTLLTNIGNFVHPYNNFKDLKVVTDSLGEVNIIINKLYTTSMIEGINNKVEAVFKELFQENMSIEDKILTVHDYIIDTTVYDSDGLNNNFGNAYGLFFDGRVKCSGYADAMAIVLNKLNVKNYKVASEEHVWNAIYINGEWLHLDLTWDDPVVNNNATISDVIRHKFYLIDTKTLKSYDNLQHNFDEKIYFEVK